MNNPESIRMAKEVYIGKDKEEIIGYGYIGIISISQYIKCNQNICETTQWDMKPTRFMDGWSICPDDQRVHGIGLWASQSSGTLLQWEYSQ